ncbi:MULTISPECIES: hypothetical protein [unclassified Luteococcus]|uniref:hypothetical protein n=1 Tax=unclassified Luteococcus TaxID=2639923 RepID=UPI00313E3426
MISSEALIQLCEQHWYDAALSMLAGRIRSGDSDPAILEAHQLAGVAQRVLSLDAEDFGQIAETVPERAWAERLWDSGFPHGPRETHRGALGSLVPLYELMLEVLNLRSERGEPQSLVVTAHLIGEYLCQLAWQGRLGHGGDPLRLGQQVGERWGTDDPSCPHNSAMRATAKRAINAAQGDQVGFTSYLDKFHSRLGDTLAVCAMNHQTIEAGERPDVGPTCPNPCGWVLQGSRAERRDLDARLRLALVYLDSPLVALRHHAPVGHFFGVPSVAEISEGWLRTWEKLTVPWADGSNPLIGAVPTDPDEALPGLSALITTVAGQRIGQGSLLREIGDDIIAALRRARS